MKNIIWLIAVVVLTVLLIKQCGKEPKTVTKIQYINKTDTIVKTQIERVPQIRYVRRTITEQGKDSIIYVEKPRENDTTVVVANEYDATVKTDSSRADLKILTTGELLDVKGTITYTQKNTETKIIKDKSGLFLYGEVPLSKAKSYGIGLDYQIRNKIIIGVSGSMVNDQFYANAKIGIKIF